MDDHGRGRYSARGRTTNSRCRPPHGDFAVVRRPVEDRVLPLGNSTTLAIPEGSDFVEDRHTLAVRVRVDGAHRHHALDRGELHGISPPGFVPVYLALFAVIPPVGRTPDVQDLVAALFAPADDVGDELGWPCKRAARILKPEISFREMVTVRSI